MTFRWLLCCFRVLNGFKAPKIMFTRKLLKFHIMNLDRKFYNYTILLWKQHTLQFCFRPIRKKTQNKKKSIHFCARKKQPSSSVFSVHPKNNVVLTDRIGFSKMDGIGGFLRSDCPNPWFKLSLKLIIGPLNFLLKSIKLVNLALESVLEFLSKIGSKLFF